MKLLTFSIVFSIILFSCNQDKTKKPFLAKKQNAQEQVHYNLNRDFDSIIEVLPNFILPMSSDSISNFINRNEGYYDVNSTFLSDNIAYANKKKLFNNTTSVIKDEEFFFYQIIDKTYYPLFKLIKDNNYIIGSLVKFYGENDIPGVAFNLNIFDKEGNQIDCLIIFNRFSWEINYKYDFQIDSSFSITIDKLIENYFDDEKEDFIKEDEKPESIEKTEIYSISGKGLLLKMKK